MIFFLTFNSLILWNDIWNILIVKINLMFVSAEVLTRGCLLLVDIKENAYCYYIKIIFYPIFIVKSYNEYVSFYVKINKSWQLIMIFHLHLYQRLLQSKFWVNCYKSFITFYQGFGKLFLLHHYSSIRFLIYISLCFINHNKFQFIFGDILAINNFDHTDLFSR